MAGVLGLYFGPKIINIAESKGKKILKNITVLRSALSEGELEEKVPEDVKMVAVFNDELRKNQIEAKEATISLSGHDLIVRTFELPVLPANELASAVNFEAKKYIPFKVEDLVSDFQVEFDKRSHKNLVLFVGIKKEILDKYIGILNQLGIKANYIDYSAFSILRFLRLAGLGHKGVIGVISMDLQEEDETNFTVLENGIPVFSRDITIVGAARGLVPAEEMETGMVLEKLKTEIRISLDYYHRKFPNKEIKKVCFICDEINRQELEVFMREIGLAVQSIDITKYLPKAQPFSLTFIKGYGASLSKVIRTGLKVNLLAPRVKVIKRVSVEGEGFSLLADIKIEPRTAILGLFICLAAFGFGFYRSLPVRQELAKVIGMRPQVSSVNPDSSYEELKKIDTDYKTKLNTLDNLIKKQLYLTQPLDLIPRNMPEDMLLTGLSFQKTENRAEITLSGFVYLGNREEELSLINNFILRLKETPEFSQQFKEIGLVSAQEQDLQKVKVTAFTISCRNYK